MRSLVDDRLWAYSAEASGQRMPEGFEHGDRICLPASWATRQPQSESVWLLELRTPTTTTTSNSTTTALSLHCSVLQYTAPNNTALLPVWMQQHLQLLDGDSVVLRTARLPVATRCTLRPLNYADFARVSKAKAVLESALRRYATLTTGTCITLDCRGQELVFDVVSTSPANAVCIVDADVVTEFELPEEAQQMMQRDTEQQQQQQQQKIDSDKFGSAGAAVSLSSAQLGASENTVLCDNCSKYVAKDSAERHRAFCERSVFRCPDCGERMEKSEREAHIEARHALQACELCGESFPKDLLSTHRDFECANREVECGFCGVDFRESELAAHAAVCGARTEKCLLCGKFVKLSEQALHEASGCVFGATQELFERCTLCGERFANAAQLAAHDREQHAAFRVAGSAAVAEVELLQCPHCAASYRTLSSLESHIAAEHDTQFAVDLLSDSSSAGEGNAGVSISDSE